MGSDGRGVDNSIDGWMTDYLICAIMAMMAARLCFLKNSSKWAAATQLCMSGGYLFGALGHHIFPNRAIDSPCGDHGFYLSWFAAYTFQSLSCICWLKWADDYIHWKWTCVPMIMACSVAAVSAIIINIGSLWCLIGGNANLVSTGDGYIMSYDQLEEFILMEVGAGGVLHQPTANRLKACSGKRPLCDMMTQVAEGLFYVAWGWAWQLVAFRVNIFLRDNYYRAFPEDTTQEFEGMWMNFKMSSKSKYRLLQAINFWCPFALFTYGPFLILYVVAYAISFDFEPNELYSDMHVGVVYHCGVISCHICTYYVSQNVEKIVKSFDEAKKA